MTHIYDSFLRVFENHRKFACEFKLDLSLSLGIGSPELKHFGHFELENQLGEFGFDIGLYEDDTFTTLASGRVLGDLRSDWL